MEAIVALAWDGPQIAVYTVSLDFGTTPERVEGLAGALAITTGADSARIARDGGHLLLELAKPNAARKPLRAGRLDALRPPAATAVAAGITTGGRALWLDLADERFAHIVIGGTTGSGKTVLLRWLLYRLLTQNAPDSLRLLLMDPKRFELRDFAQVPHLLHPIVQAPLDVARVLAWLTAELDRRAASGRYMPRILVVVEEAADLTATNRAVAPLMARVAQIGRALGVHLVVTTQQPGAAALGRALVNFPCRVIGRVASATRTYGAAGRARTAADALLGRGDFLLIAAGETIRFQAPLADARQYSKLPRADHVASLEADLPTAVEFADRNHDPRGGRGRRELAEDDYDAIADALEAGATPEIIRDRFNIGWERARRIHQQYWGANP